MQNNQDILPNLPFPKTPNASIVEISSSFPENKIKSDIKISTSQPHIPHQLEFRVALSA